jgi:hypothetical protein
MSLEPSEMMLTGRMEELGQETCPSVTLSTTNPKWTDTGVRDERPASNRLSHGTAYLVCHSVNTVSVRILNSLTCSRDVIRC